MNCGLARDASSPVSLEAADVRAAPGLEALPSRTVRINATKIIDPGVRLQKKSSSGAPGAKLKYLLVQVQDQFLIAEVREEVPNSNSLTGRLTEWTSNPYQEVIAEVRSKVPASSTKLLSFQMDCNLEHEALSFYLWIFVAFLGLLGLVALAGGLNDKVVPSVAHAGLDHDR